jgi:hypothetical protein
MRLIIKDFWDRKTTCWPRSKGIKQVLTNKCISEAQQSDFETFEDLNNFDLHEPFICHL